MERRKTAAGLTIEFGASRKGCAEAGSAAGGEGFEDMQALRSVCASLASVSRSGQPLARHMEAWVAKYTCCIAAALLDAGEAKLLLVLKGESRRGRRWPH